MKKIFLFSVIFFAVAASNGQKKFDEKKGQEILKLFPAKMKDKDAKKINDKVKDAKGAKGFLGVIVHRDYGENDKSVRVEVINYSPSLISINNFLNNPIDDPAKYKMILIGGYKALIQTLIGETGKLNYELLLPMTATLLAVRTTGYTRDDLIAMANTIPVATIAKMVEQ